MVKATLAGWAHAGVTRRPIASRIMPPPAYRAHMSSRNVVRRLDNSAPTHRRYLRNAIVPDDASGVREHVLAGDHSLHHDHPLLGWLQNGTCQPPTAKATVKLRAEREVRGASA